ncbi:MAG: winged helix-turn-helix domain-containing protein [Acetatifactor sp.]|nr:winged helix-turn-helix domain-containing protein [Acetatifactor sp.]
MRELAPILKREEVIVQFTEEKQKLYDYLDQNDIQLVIVEMQEGQRELLDELELLSEIRKKSCVSIIVISDEENESTKIITLNAGADDYISTSCSPLEILARIQAQLRRYSQLSNVFRKMDKIYQVGELLVDDRYRIVMVEGRSVNLTPIEYKILKLLVQEKGKVISISQIYEAIWHMKAVGVDNTVAVHICHIREKIESNPKKPQYLKAVWGSGYKVG